ncbi:DNA translocase FtsK 4TM domain-containing protein [Marivivens marinus]|uniref:DNA translocase FtsK n=1 Tax=Marivivens marinus TaxID=3110173 RepID=UPI003B845569
MASYTTRQRDPLLDSTTQAALEKRGRELLGIGLVVLGVMAGMMIGTYSPEDPNWMLATDAPVQNWMGRAGASIAAPLFMIAGWATWGIALCLTAWGVRMVMHNGQDRALGRIIFAPIAIAVAAVYASTLAPGQGWTHSFGLGGLFGDTALSIGLTILPVPASIGVKLFSLIAGVLTLVLAAFVLGFTRPELRQVGRFLLIGLIVLYTLVLRVLGKGASASMKAATGLHETVQTRREQARAERAQLTEEYEAEQRFPAPPTAEERSRVAAVIRANPVMPTHRTEPQMHRAMPPLPQDAGWADEPLVAPVRAQPAPTGGLRGLMPSLLRRQPDPMPAPELVDPGLAPDPSMPVDGDRIRSRITEAIRARQTATVAQPPVTRTEAGLRIEPSLTAGKGPRPLVFAPTAPTPVEADFAPQAPVVADEDDLLVLEDEWMDEMPPVDSRAPLTAEPLFDTQEQAQPRVQTPTAEPRKVVQHQLNRKVIPSKQARAEAQPKLQFEDRHADYEHPPLSLLMNPIEIQRHHLSDEALEENARMLESVLDDYGVKGEIVSVRPGPVVTMYELEPAPGLKASRVIGLADDIARSMSALSARVSTVPGRSVIGIELPNAAREKVVLREILAARDFGDSNMKLPLALGKDIGGDPIVANLAKMPHLLIAGTTGSGKSVAINTMILSLLYKLTPDECRLIMIDPKMLELSVYDGIPHLLSPVVTDPKKAVVALKWVVGEMEERYRKMSKMGVRNIEGYNGRVADALGRNEMFSRTVQTGFDEETGDPIFETEEFAPEKMPYIVVIVDEMADLMMVAGKEIEACIQRLAQMARASGIHLIMATQRPSVDVITGTIKANFPTRISFQVTSKIDSRTILGEQGAEQLLGMGDMLYMAGGGRISRVHGPFVSDEEVEEIVNYLKGFGPPEYMSGVVDGPDEEKGADIDLVLGLGGNTDGEDALYDQAVAIVAKDRKCSTSYIQRKLAIGYNKAARLVEQMEDEGVVSAANHVGKREVLVPEQH